MKLKGFVGPTYTLRTTNYDAQRTINLFPEVDETQLGKEGEVAALVSVPGFSLIHQIPRSPIRGIYFTANGYIIVVAGNGVYSLTTTDGINYTHTLFATLTTNTGAVSIVDGVSNYYNGIVNTGYINSVIIVDGSNYGLSFEEGTTAITQLNPGNGYMGSNFVTFQDGYFIFAQPNSIVGYFTSDPLVINDLDTMVNTLGSDTVSRVISDHDIVWMFGNRTSSVWQNTGSSGASNVFQQIPGSFAEGGCSAPHTIQKVGGQLIWLNNDERGSGQVFQAMGYRGVRISNHAVELWLQSAGSLSNASAWSYQDLGHTFYCLNVPGSTTTWCYDLTTKMWCERAYFSNGNYSRDLIEYHICADLHNIAEVHICGDYQNGNLYALSNSNYTHNGQPIKRMRTAPHLSSAQKRVYYSQLQLDLESGVGLDGAGYQLVQGTTGSPVLQTATNVELLGNGPTYNFAGNDGTIQTPSNVPTLSANGTWTNAFTYSGNSVTITPGTLTIPSTQFGIGNGQTSNFSISNLAGQSITSYSVYANDWRGNNLQSTTPVTNLCTYSQTFTISPWGTLGSSLSPSAWSVLTTDNVVAYRPSTGASVGNVYGTLTNTANAYDGGTQSWVKNQYGTYATNVGNINGGVIAQYSGFGSGLNITGVLNIAVTTTAPDTTGSNGALVIWYSLDAGATWHSGWHSNATATMVPGGMLIGPGGTTEYMVGDAYLGRGVIYNASSPITYSMTIPDMSKFMVQLMAAGSSSSTCSYYLYDLAFVTTNLVAGSQVTAPDGSFTGTIIKEDTSTGFHALTYPFTGTSGNQITASVYALKEDINRGLLLGINGVSAAFTASIATNQMTVTTTTSGTIAVGQTVVGNGIPPNTTIVSGPVGNVWTLSYSVLSAISLQTMSSYSYVAKTYFNLNTQAMTTSVGSSAITPIGNNIFRCSVSGTETVTGSNAVTLGMYNANGTAYDTYTGNGGSFVGIWGCQIQENTATPTPYIHTTGLATTDYVSFSTSTGIVTFNVPPLSGALLTGSGSVFGTSIGPVQYYASFQYYEALPNYVSVGTNPQVSLSYSDDGGHSFSPERSVSLGTLGQYKNRLIWRRLGQSRDRVFRISCADPVKFNILSAEIKASEGQVNG